MAEHLHGYPRCETPAGSSCTSSDLHFDECKGHGAIRSCEASVVDGIPTGQYRCLHADAARSASAKPASKRKAKPARAAKKKPAPKKKAAARKPAKKAAKKVKKTRPAAKKKAAKKGGARKKK